MTRVYETIPETTGKTPSVLLNQVTGGIGCAVLPKLESQNLGGSAKDRTWLCMITETEKRGLISKETTMIEHTSGNAVTSLARASDVRGYCSILTMPETICVERCAPLRPHRAELVLTHVGKGTKRAVRKTEELASATWLAKDYLRYNPERSISGRGEPR